MLTPHADVHHHSKQALNVVSCLKFSLLAGSFLFKYSNFEYCCRELNEQGLSYNGARSVVLGLLVIINRRTAWRVTCTLPLAQWANPPPSEEILVHFDCTYRNIVVAKALGHAQQSPFTGRHILGIIEARRKQEPCSLSDRHSQGGFFVVLFPQLPVLRRGRDRA